MHFSDGDDYTSVSTYLEFSPQNSEQPLCISVAIENDIILENDEHFDIQFTAIDPSVQLGINSTVIYITDDDGRQFDSLFALVSCHSYVISHYKV